MKFLLLVSFVKNGMQIEFQSGFMKDSTSEFPCSHKGVDVLRRISNAFMY